jgi:hypothetical protein
VRSTPLALTCLALLALGACARGGGSVRVDDQRQSFNRWTLQTLDDESISNAIVAQSTLYAYHFAGGAAELNDLGQRDLKVLAGHYSRYPGAINVRRGAESEELYNARVQAVSTRLASLGVPATSIEINDGMPGGDGIASDRAVKVLERTYQAAAPAPTTATATATTSAPAGQESNEGNE